MRLEKDNVQIMLKMLKFTIQQSAETEKDREERARAEAIARGENPIKTLLDKINTRNRQGAPTTAREFLAI